MSVEVVEYRLDCAIYRNRICSLAFVFILLSSLIEIFFSLWKSFKNDLIETEFFLSDVTNFEVAFIEPKEKQPQFPCNAR